MRAAKKVRGLRRSPPLTVLAVAHTCCSYPPHFFTQLGRVRGGSQHLGPSPAAPCPSVLLAVGFPLPVLSLHVWASSVQQVPKCSCCSMSFCHVDKLSQELNLLYQVASGKMVSLCIFCLMSQELLTTSVPLSLTCHGGSCPWLHFRTTWRFKNADA